GAQRMEKWHAASRSNTARTKTDWQATGYERIQITHPPTRSGKFTVEARNLRDRTHEEYKNAGTLAEHKDLINNLTHAFEHPAWVPGRTNERKDTKPLNPAYTKGFAPADITKIADYLVPETGAVTETGAEMETPATGAVSEGGQAHAPSPSLSAEDAQQGPEFLGPEFLGLELTHADATGLAFGTEAASAWALNPEAVFQVRELRLGPADLEELFRRIGHRTGTGAGADTPGQAHEADRSGV
ncbi:hypothetical protein, partial [Streptomyces sp. NPDC048639]|uniref:hypothetical protein n=1 Tax=Streptomyces sp. NPDC048639 TaxID=3365581 RepID=UPI00371A77C3